MAILNIPDRSERVENQQQIAAFLKDRGIRFEQWQPTSPLAVDADQETILAAFEDRLKSLMEEGGYQTADVISVYPDTEGLPAIRQKFLAEHTHTEDEVRYFVEGQGLFWFNPDDQPVFSVLCQAGDLISVPANTRHWFDLGPEAYVRAIRLFTDMSGWVPHYTHSGVDTNYNPTY